VGEETVAELKKYDLTGKQVGQVAIEDAMVESQVNGQMIKDYLVALRNNARQWSANTKTRAEVKHSGQKPHPQKGTGRARQGYLGAPQYKGGGRVHTPRPKYDQHVRINKKERQAAIRHLIVEKILENKLHILQLPKMDSPKTQKVAQFLDHLNCNNKRVLFLGEGLQNVDRFEKYFNFVRSTSNIPKVEFMYLPNASGYDIVLGHEIFIMESALDELMVLLGGKK
jgi:large subunit ribosomal protein L4